MNANYLGTIVMLDVVNKMAVPSYCCIEMLCFVLRHS